MTTIATITVPMPVDARLWLDLHKTVIDWHRRECRVTGCRISMHGSDGVTVLEHGVAEEQT